MPGSSLTSLSTCFSGEALVFSFSYKTEKSMFAGDNEFKASKKFPPISIG